MSISVGMQILALLVGGHALADRVAVKLHGGVDLYGLPVGRAVGKLNEFDFEGAPSECLISLLQGTSLTAGICDPTVPIKLKINRECTRRAALMQLIALCGGEIEYNGAEINIRSHRGSQDYIGIMDGRNVLDLTMENDSRSGTTNYGLTLYKNINFSVGDNVQIVFHPFNLNVNTRIIAMSFNPYKVQLRSDYVAVGT